MKRSPGYLNLKLLEEECIKIEQQIVHEQEAKLKAHSQDQTHLTITEKPKEKIVIKLQKVHVMHEKAFISPSSKSRSTSSFIPKYYEDEILDEDDDPLSEQFTMDLTHSKVEHKNSSYPSSSGRVSPSVTVVPLKLSLRMSHCLRH